MPQTMVDLARKSICREETRKARKDAMPHERGFNASAPIRILLPCSRRSQSSLLPPVASHSPPSTRKPAYPVDIKALNYALILAPSACPSLWPEHYVPFASYQDALIIVLAQTAINPAWAEKTRNVYRSASRFPLQVACRIYLISTVATPSNFFLMASASSLVAFSFNALGAPSTRSLASFRPSEVTSRTALMVLILLAPASFRMT